MSEESLRELEGLLYMDERAELARLPDMVPALPDSLIDEAFDIALRIENETQRKRALDAIVPRIPERYRAILLAEHPELSSPDTPSAPVAKGLPTFGAKSPGARACQLAQALPEPERLELLERWIRRLLSQLLERELPKMDGDDDTLTPIYETSEKSITPPVAIEKGLPQLGKGEPPPQEHIVSVGFAERGQPAAPIKPEVPLQAEWPYYFWIEVGQPVEGSIEEQLTELPVDRLPPEARLKVALYSFDGELELQPGADVGELQISPDGSVAVARQPLAQPPAELAGDAGLLERRLFFPIATPDETGTARLRCSIYYEQILVQSRVITARIMRQPSQQERALRSRVDYTLSHKLDSARLTRMAPHQLSLMINSNGEGTHGFRFFGAGEFKNNASFGEGELGELIRMARGALRKAAWGDEEPWQNTKPYRYAGQRNLDQLKKDLFLMAIRGYRFYDELINKLAGSSGAAEQLAELMSKPGNVQIALKESARLILPAALIYDYPLDTGADQASLSFCQAWLTAMDGQAPLEESDCFKGSCPSKDDDLVICPSGFWGYRHALGMPLSVGTAPDVPPELAVKGSLQLTVGVSTDPAFVLRQPHEQALQALRQGLGWTYADDRIETLDKLKTSSPHLVYFYCHGGLSNNVPFIQVGPPNERGITRDNLRVKKIRWEQTRPLVFINGCHTTAVEPEQAIEMVSAFIENAMASGVIGTEITNFEPLARAFAEECFRRFLGGATIGEAVRGARLALLKQGNPLGMIYIPFVISSLRLVESA